MKKLFISVSAIMIVLALAFANGQAATGTIGSTVDIECAAAVHANGGTLAFGLLAASSDPANPCNTWLLTPDNGVPLIRGGAGNGVDFSFDHSKGGFDIVGSEPITYTVAVLVDFADPFLSLGDLTLNPLSPQDPTPADHTCGNKEISVGGTLTVCLGAEAKLHDDARILITANY